MSQPYLSQIHIYPVYSIAGIRLSKSWVERRGLSQDGRLIVARADGIIVPADDYPTLSNVSVLLLAEGIRLSHVSEPGLSLRYSDFPSTAANVWFSSILGEAIVVVFDSSTPTSKIVPSPISLVNKNALKILDTSAQHKQLINLLPSNIVIDNLPAFEEDSWKRVKIGHIVFDVTEVCVIDSIEKNSLEKSYSDNEKPDMSFANLAKSRAKNIDKFFGKILTPLNEGMIEVDDCIEVLQRHGKQHYVDNRYINLRLTCVAKEQIAKDFVTFWFESTTGSELPTYLPGQYLPITVAIDGKAVVRCYTLSSSPSRPDRYAISVKRVSDGIVDGAVSAFLHDCFQVGSQLDAQQPCGDFHLGERKNCLLLLSAGSGITPMLSILRYLVDSKSVDDIVFYHQCRTQENIPTLEELERIREEFSSLTLHIALSQKDSRWKGLQGRFNSEHIALIPQLIARQVFVCGPSLFMESAKKQLLDQGLPPENYHQESFSGGGGDNAVDTTPHREVCVRIDDKNFPANNQKPLLEQAESAGIMIPNSCRAGVCGMCKVMLVEGDVTQRPASALSEEEKKSGVVLACCSIPNSDVKLNMLPD
jgi:ferredoxin-NADP reductase/uncharacterized protein YcbX